MELVIRIALMFFFIQFLVIITIMTMALLLARPEVSVCESWLSHSGLRRLTVSGREGRAGGAPAVGLFGAPRPSAVDASDSQSANNAPTRPGSFRSQSTLSRH